MDARQFFEPTYNALAMGPRLAEQKLAVQQNNALMDLRQQGMDLDRQRLGMEQQQNALKYQQYQSEMAEMGAFRQAAGELENTPEGHAQLQRRFPMLYQKAGLSSMLPEQPKLAGDYQTYLSAMGVPNSPDAYRAWQRDVLEQKRAGATKIENNINGNTPGRTKADQVFGEEYANFVASGGYADVEKQLNQLDEVVSALESGQNISGPLIGSTPDSVLKFTNPAAISAREKVEEVAQRNLRIVLGAQFTEKEGDRLIRRAFNPNLSEAENAKRVRRLLGQIKAAARAKQEAANYFEQNGTLTGWRGKMPTFSDFARAIEGTAKPTTDKGTGGSDPLGIR